jgi:predicted transcriptional regulator
MEALKFYSKESLLDILYSDNLEDWLKAAPNLNKLLDTVTDEIIESQIVKPKVKRTLDIVSYEISKVGIGSILLTHKEIADLTGTSSKTVERHLQELEEKGLLFVDRYKNPVSGQQMTNEYSLIPFNAGKPNGSFTVESLRDDEYWNPFSGTYEPIKRNGTAEECLQDGIEFLSMMGC